MMLTRSKTKRRTIYRARVKRSPCRNRTETGCRKKYGCKYTRKGKRASYCRKSHNRSA